MKKNGFTLVELIGTILILGLISSIVVPAIMRIVRNAKDNTYNEQITYIEKSAQRWAAYNVKKLSETRSYYLSTDDLLSEGYLDGSDIKDPRNTNNTISGCVVITYDSAYSQYTFNFTNDACSTLGTNVVETAETCFTRSGSTITGYTCSDREITIPKKVGGTTITAIGAGAFKTKYLNAVELQEGIITIGNNAFEDNRIKEIKIPTTVTTIGNNAFNKNKLQGVIIPNSVTSLGSYAFANNSIKNVSIGTGINAIGAYAFANNQLGGVKVPGNVKVINSNAFQNNNLTNVILSSGVENLGANAFAGNAITTLNLPNSTKQIGDNAFLNNKIKTIKIPSSVTSFNCTAFKGNETTSFEFLSASTALSNGASCKNATNFYSTSNVNVPVGSLSHYQSQGTGWTFTEH